ncbi:flagellar biosynthesis protein FlhB [Pseudoruegeria sp. SK021]|uniref:EscU/YscU/HrcU family type III secretion system export apparatus switch protein n=1 Tax=Pseudoruegeria sp. SK021 TaxID=1933035 RepID=UPI000A26085A|nr:flagellar type III secretion system protein FlhB [Pseudoruegeria sp. SK021]OSP54754.1 flagellar biosynthesis protein FlhB [Pseudoruegeria sp. SK021]
MSGAGDDDSEKPYEASQRKLDEARKKGEIPRSTDIITAAAYGGFLLVALVFGANSLQALGTSLMVLLDQADSLSVAFLADGGRSLAGGAMARVGLALLPWFLIPAAVVLAVILAQQGFTVTVSKLEPKLSRLSLLSNLKNKFGRGGLFEFAKSLTKLILISTVLGLFLRAQLPVMLSSVSLGPGGVVAMMARQSVGFFWAVVAIAGLLGAIDLLWQRAEHARKNRMSHKEMVDESKQAEGDPHMKQQRRQRAYDIATNRMMADVPKADVIVVNPEHYAVALQWSRDKGSAPICVAKGVDEVAARIREAAMTAGVPLHRDPPTARALHATTEIGQQIGQEHFRAVASAIRFADQMRLRRKSR